MKIKALKAFTVRDSETGELTSIAHGAVAEVDGTLGESLISDGLAEAYTLVNPSGSITITENGTYDVAEKASAVVNIASSIDALIDGSMTEINSNATRIRANAFETYSALASANFPLATEVGANAFSGCNHLASISFPSLTTISNGAFMSCSSLTSVDFPSVTSIASNAFASASNLTTIILRNTEGVCTLNAGNAIPSNVTSIYVPDALVDSYKSATYWSNIASKIKPLSEYTA